MIAQPFDTTYVSLGKDLTHVTITGNQTIIEEGLIENGLRTGTWTTYWMNGFPRTLTSYHRSKKNGMLVNIGQDGSISSMAQYNMDILNGINKIYFPSKGIAIEELYKDGIKHGLSVHYYENGQIKEKSYYSNGQRHGLTEWYSTQGKKTAIYIYKNDKLDGEFIHYHDNGSIAQKGQYKMDEEVGLWTSYNEQGKLITSEKKK